MAEEEQQENTACKTKPRSKLNDQRRVELIKNAIKQTEELQFLVKLETMDVFNGVQDPLQELRQVEGYLAMTLLPFKDLGKWERELIIQTVNISRFENEEVENKVPRLSEAKIRKKNYDISFERSVVFLPGLRLEDFSKELLSNYEYLIKVFKDTGIETWEDGTYDARSECTCRWSAQAIPLLYRMTCQWEISELDSDTLANVSEHFNLDYHRGFMMERTKQNIHQNADANLKTRVFMLYYETEDGVVLDFVWYCILNFGIFTRTGVLLAYNALDIGAEMIKCFHLCRTQMLEYFEEKLGTDCEMPKETVPEKTPLKESIAGEETTIVDLVGAEDEPDLTDSLSLD